MKYFGKKSLSSFMSGLLHATWYVVLVGSIFAPVILGTIVLFSTPIGDSIMSTITKGDFNNCSKDVKEDLAKDITDKDLKDWEMFKNLPLAVKFLILPYFEAVLILLLHIIKKSQHLFTNFKNDMVFNKNNVLLISKISKLLIVFSIITFSFSSLLLSVVLLLLCEIIKNGTLLQEEHDFTV